MSLPLPGSRGTLIPRPTALCHSSSSLSPILTHLVSPLTRTHVRTHVITLYKIISHLTTLNSDASAKSPLPRKAAYSQDLGFRMWTSLGGYR